MSEEKKGFFSREYTRRQFMSLSAKGLTGVALSGSLLSLMGITQSQAESGQIEVLATPEYLLVADRNRCTGCQRCEANCTLARDGNVRPYMARIRVRDNENFGQDGPTDDFDHGDGVFGQWAIDPETCKQCGDAPCVKACPVGAISASEANGARVVDEEKCVGCGACVAACPWSMPRLNPETRKSSKCINCGACVRGCPTSALKMIDWEDVAAAM